MRKTLLDQLAALVPSLGLKVQKDAKKISKVGEPKAKHHSKEKQATKKYITREEMNELRIKEMIYLSKLGREGKERYYTDMSDTLDYIEVARSNKRISIIDEFFCLYAALRGAIHSHSESLDDVRSRLCDVASRVSKSIETNQNIISKNDFERFKQCEDFIKMQSNILKAQYIKFQERQSAEKAIKHFTILAEKILRYRLDITEVIHSSPILDSDDIQLALAWSNIPMFRDKSQNDIKELITNNYSKYFDLVRLLSARVAEKAAIIFYQSCGREVEDISIQQIKPNANQNWKYYDLKVNNVPVDVKNSRRLRDDRYVEHCVQEYKTVGDEGQVIITGILSQYLRPEMLLSPKNSDVDTSIIFLGETTHEKHLKLKEEFEQPFYKLDFTRTDGGKKHFLPPWIFDYPLYTYMQRDQAIAKVKNQTIPDLNLFEKANLNLLPVCIAAKIDLSKYWQTDTLKEWEWDFFHDLLACVTKHGLSLPFLYLSLQSHFIRMIYLNSGDTITDYSPDIYKRFAFFNAEMANMPLGIYDPLNTILKLIDTLKVLWTSQHDLIREFKNFRMSGFNILQGRINSSERWKTLVAYCGGRKANKYKCGKYPLVLGESKHCEICGKLICPDCNFCSENCNRRNMEETIGLMNEDGFEPTHEYWEAYDNHSIENLIPEELGSESQPGTSSDN